MHHDFDRVQNNLGLACKITLMFSRAIFYLWKLEKIFELFKINHWLTLFEEMLWGNKLHFFFLCLATIMQLFNNIEMPSISIDLFIFHMIIRTHKIFLNCNSWYSNNTLSKALMFDQWVLCRHQQFSLPSIYEQIVSLTIFPYSLQGAIVILCLTKWKAKWKWKFFQP